MTSARVPFWSLVEVGENDRCWPWRGTVDRDGYGVWGRERAHRVVYREAYNCVLSPRAVVRHDCDNPRCCNPFHMRGGFQVLNVADRVERDRSARGTANGRNVLTPEQALSAFRDTRPLRTVAAELGVSPWTIRDIKRGKLWGWLTAPERSAGA